VRERAPEEEEALDVFLGSDGAWEDSPTRFLPIVILKEQVEDRGASNMKKEHIEL